MKDYADLYNFYQVAALPLLAILCLTTLVFNKTFHHKEVVKRAELHSNRCGCERLLLVHIILTNHPVFTGIIPVYYDTGSQHPDFERKNLGVSPSTHVYIMYTHNAIGSFPLDLSG